MMGESYHNNHHKYGSRPNFGGVRWHEIDPTYQIIKVLAKLKVIRFPEKQIKISDPESEKRIAA